jgi:hypothetical protein
MRLDLKPSPICKKPAMKIDFEEHEESAQNRWCWSKIKKSPELESFAHCAT